MNSVSVIVVTYNRLSMLKECMNNLLGQDFQLNSIFVVNNNSSDGTKEYLDELYKSTIVIPKHLKENIGGAGGFSYGLKCAYEESSSKYFLIMDDDTMVRKDTITSLVDKAKDIDFGFLCSDVRWYKDDSACLLNCPEVKRDWNDKISNGLIKLESASFVSFMVSREMVNKVGLPISEMFIWADDVEYSNRLSKIANSYMVTDSKVTHKCKSNSSSESIFNCDYGRIIYYKCMYRNRMYIYRKHYDKKYALIYFVNYLSTAFLSLFKSKDHRLKRCLSVLLGATKGIVFNPKIKFPD